MSYPDEWKAEVEAMAADLATRSVPLPESLRLINTAARMAWRSIPPPFIAERIVAEVHRRRSWGEAIWTARDLLRPPLMFS